MRSVSAPATRGVRAAAIGQPALKIAAADVRLGLGVTDEEQAAHGEVRDGSGIGKACPVFNPRPIAIDSRAIPSSRLLKKSAEYALVFAFYP